MSSDNLFSLWSNRVPRYEKRYKKRIIEQLTDYGTGSSSYQESRAKIFGAGYEVYILAFFIGLYSNRRKILTLDNDKLDHFGHPIKYWGNNEKSKLRKNYSNIQKYMFMAVVARSEIDFLSVDKEEISINKVIKSLILIMEEYANFGFDFIEDKLLDNPDFFYKNSAFLDIFISMSGDSSQNVSDNDNSAESLD